MNRDITFEKKLDRILRNQKIMMLTMAKETTSKRSKRRLSEEIDETLIVLHHNAIKELRK